MEESKRIEKVTRTSVVKEIVASVLKMVKKGSLKVGDALPTESELSEMFGVGRSSVREALSALQAMDIIEKRQGLGAFLTSSVTSAEEVFNLSSISERFSIIELIEARKIMEEQIVLLATKKATKEDVAKMEAKCLQHKEAINRGEMEEALGYDCEFHKSIAEGTHNSFLVDMLGMLSEVTIATNRTVYNQEKAENAIIHHQKIITSIANKDTKNAVKAMSEHLDDIRKGAMLE